MEKCYRKIVIVMLEEMKKMMMEFVERMLVKESIIVFIMNDYYMVIFEKLKEVLEEVK